MESLATREIEGLGAALLVVDASGRVTWANAVCESILGSGLAGVRLDRQEDLEDRSSLLFEVAGRLAGAPGPALIVAPHDGGPRYYWMTRAALGNGAQGGHLVMLNDITDALTGSPFLRKIFSQVSHDLKSPLTSISGACELLGSGRVGTIEGTQRKLVGIIEEGTRRMEEILESAKGRFARAESAASGNSGG